MTEEELATFERWRDRDPDAITAAHLDAWITSARAGDTDALSELRDAFSGRLAFGTAGLRGALGPGPNRMNRVVVSEAAAGFGAWLIDAGLGGSRIIVGYDARHQSDVFARDTAEILAGLGLRPILTETHVPTPVIAFGIRHLDCAGAVMVTASHNPPEDNGYKVYVGPSQIVPPVDTEIAAHIEQAATRAFGDHPRSKDYETIGDTLLDAYADRAASLLEDDVPRDLSWAYTPLHGVGAEVVARVLDRCGFALPALVSEQAVPDPDFPTVSFPNPEEPGAMDLALQVAGHTGASVAIANDPDADRCAVAVPLDGAWRMLSGDELGWLLADDALRRGTPGTYACSVVSSTLLASLAAAAAQPFAMTLTGFKWIGRVPGLAFGYEEAIGYCTDPAAVADKDGISTLVRVLSLASRLEADGQTFSSRLDDLARTFGVHLTGQSSFRTTEVSLISDAMTRIRATPPNTLLGETAIVVDLATGWQELPPTDGLLVESDRFRAVVRPSGTEPKLKCYFQVRLPPEPTTVIPVARQEAAALMDRLQAEITEVLGL